jgi:hypothetical protein
MLCICITWQSQCNRMLKYNIVTCRGVRVTDIVSSRFDWLDLLYVTITISLDYNSSHIWPLLDNESLTVVWIFHWRLVFSSLSFCRILSPFEWVLYYDRRPVCLGIKHPSGAYDQIFITVKTVACFLMLGALSDERTILSFTIAAGPRQRIHFRDRVPWDSWPHFTVSDSRLPFSSPPMVEVSSFGQFSPWGRFWSNRMEITSLKGFPFMSPM